MILTSKEAKVLTVLDESGANTYQLASGAELTISEVREAVSHLVEDRLVEEEDDGRYLKLTHQGQRVRRSLAGPQPGPASAPRGGRIVVVPERQDRTSDHGKGLDTAALDAALDAEIQKRSS